MNKYLLLYCAMWLSVPTAALSQSMSSTPVELTLEEAYRRMLHANKTLQIADQGVAMAQSEFRKTAGTWWPSLQARGAYVAMANDIGVDFTLLEHTFSFPLIRQHLSDISLSLTWPVFAGGRRLLGTSLARQGIHLARLQRLNTQASLQTTLVAAYYALYLTHHVTQVRYAAYQSLRRHYAEARQLEAQGMLTHADCLYTRLCQDEAEREWQDSERQRQVAHRALGTLLGEAETHSLQPVSPFFVMAQSPSSSQWLEEMDTGNFALRMLQTQHRMAQDKLRLAQAEYLPTVALTGRQSVYAYHLPKNLLPHTMVGVGFTWNLFDGFRREATVRQAKLTLHTLSLTREQTQDELQVAVFKLTTDLQDAEDKMRSLHTAVALGEELCRMRSQAFKEGMATSLEVTDAEVLLAKTRVAELGAEYEYVVTLASLCTVAGCPERFWELRESK
jgi:outer membrane protein TolC